MSAAEGEALSLLSRENPFGGNGISPSIIYPLDNYLNGFASARHGCAAPAMQAQSAFQIPSVPYAANLLLTPRGL